MARLITLGHHNCTDYGISFFHDAIAASTELENERVRSVACAMRVSKAQQKDFDKFIDVLTPKAELSEEEVRSNQDEFIKMFG